MPETDTPESLTNQDYKKLFVKKNLFLRKHENQENEDEFLDLIRFSLDNETYGIELSRMKEILKVKNIENIPKSPKYLLGILNLRSTLITIVDLKQKLGFEVSQTTSDSRIIIVEHERRSIGFLVDKVNEIMKLEKRSIIDPPAGVNVTHREFIRGVGKTKDLEVILLELNEILSFHIQE